MNSVSKEIAEMDSSLMGNNVTTVTMILEMDAIIAFDRKDILVSMSHYSSQSVLNVGMLVRSVYLMGSASCIEFDLS